MSLPDYSGGSIVNLMASLVEGMGGENAGYAPLPCLTPEEVGSYRQVVLMVVDGLGCDFLSRRRGRSALEELSRARLTSVFPTTTASAITSFLTGVAPQQHGLTGWHMYFQELATVLAVLPGKPRYGGVPLKEAGIDPVRFFNHRSVFDQFKRDSYIVTPRYIANSDFNLAHRGKAEVKPYDSQADYFLKITELLKTGSQSKFIYAYWPELDRISHESGCNSIEANWHFTSWEAGFRTFLKTAAGTGSLILLTADHGFIDTQPERTVDIHNHPALAKCLSLPLCGEKRLAYCYVKPNHYEEFEYLARTLLQDQAEVRRSHELIAEGWFGLGPAHERLQDRIGDFVLIMKDNWIIEDWIPGEHRHELIGVHGGTSQQEMKVPLLVAAV